MTCVSAMTCLAAGTALALDTGAEPIYQLLPEIPMAGAALPAAAPGFVTAETVGDTTTLRWGSLFRIAGDPRVYGRLDRHSERFAALPGTTVSYARSPSGQYLAEAEIGTASGMVRVLPVTGAPSVTSLDAAGMAAQIGPATCGKVADVAEWTADTAGMALTAVTWTSETDLRMLWVVPVKVGTAALDSRHFDVTIQVAGIAEPKMLSCAPVAADATVAKAPSLVRRDLVARLRTLTYYRLAVMQEAAQGARPTALAVGPGLAFSNVTSNDPAVQAAMTAMQPLIVVSATEPPQIRSVAAARPRATGFLRPVENGLPPPKFNRVGFGAIRGENQRFGSDGFSVGRGERLGGSGD